MLPKRRKVGDQEGDVEESQLLNEDHKKNEKYLTLTQVNVKIAGGTDKLLVVRDVTATVTPEQVMETRRSVTKVTDQLMTQLESHLDAAEQDLQKLDQYIGRDGKPLGNQCAAEVKRMQYRVKDLQQL